MPVVLVIVFTGFAVLMVIWQSTRSSRQLESWARDNQFELMNVERRRMMRGRYSLTTGKGQEVFRVTARDAAGNVREGFVRVGGMMLGQLSDHTDVTWDEPK